MSEAVTVRAHQLKSDGTLAVVIPKKIRERLGIKKGTKLVVFADASVVKMQPLDTLTGEEKDDSE